MLWQILSSFHLHSWAKGKEFNLIGPSLKKKRNYGALFLYTGENHVYESFHSSIPPPLCTGKKAKKLTGKESETPAIYFGPPT
jgi:hypothetical protein